MQRRPASARPASAPRVQPAQSAGALRARDAPRVSYERHRGGGAVATSSSAAALRPLSAGCARPTSATPRFAGAYRPKAVGSRPGSGTAWGGPAPSSAASSRSGETKAFRSLYEAQQQSDRAQEEAAWLQHKFELSGQPSPAEGQVTVVIEYCWNSASVSRPSSARPISPVGDPEAERRRQRQPAAQLSTQLYQLNYFPSFCREPGWGSARAICCASARRWPL